MARDMVQVKRAGRQGYKGPDLKIGRSQFDMSHGVKTMYDAGYLVPFCVMEILPGDTFTCSLDGFLRIFSPLDAPVMDNIEVETMWFFVPNRLVWSNWVDFQGEHVGAGAQDTDYTIPIIADGLTIDHDHGTAAQDLGAYFGLPDGLQTTLVEVSALPWRGYNLIYNEWFRDQNILSERTVALDNGPDATAPYLVRKSNKKHDYFTSGLPYLQKGDPVMVPIGGEAPVWGLGPLTDNFVANATPIRMAGGLTPTPAFAVNASLDASNVLLAEDPDTLGFPDLYADLTLATGVSVNALRESVAIQRLLERDARGGTRYTEMIKSHFGVTNPDFRLQRPEYLGGGKSFVNISPVANTSATATEDQGEFRGVGTGVISGHGWAKSFTEHGYLMGIVRARGDLTYFQGLEKHWSRSTRLDFYVPALANLGEQAILNKEIWVSNNVTIDAGVFAYQQRWEEYRQKRSMITNKMNPDAAGALSHWHLAEDFGSLPVLNETFIADGTPMSRITTVDSEPDFIMDLWINLKAARPIPVFSIPALTSGRF